MVKDALNVAIAVFFLALSGFLVFLAALAFYLIAPPRPAPPGESSVIPALTPIEEPPLYMTPGEGGGR